MMWIACSVMWVACAAVTIAGVMVTKSPWCLWLMIIPSLIRFSSDNDAKKDRKET